MKYWRLRSDLTSPFFLDESVRSCKQPTFQDVHLQLGVYEEEKVDNMVEARIDSNMTWLLKLYD